MHPFKRIKTEEQLAKLSYDLDIARAKVYQNWGFTLEEIACLVDRPESEIREALPKHGGSYDIPQLVVDNSPQRIRELEQQLKEADEKLLYAYHVIGELIEKPNAFSDESED